MKLFFYCLKDKGWIEIFVFFLDENNQKIKVVVLYYRNLYSSEFYKRLINS